MAEIAQKLLTANGLITAVALVAVIMFIAQWIATAIKQKRMASALAIVIGLILAYVAGKYTGGSKGLADVKLLAGMGLLGGSMFRDFAIISTAYGVKAENLKKAGVPGTISIFVGVFFSFFVGAAVAVLMGFRNSADIATIGAGACTFIVGPVTGTALGASSEVVALSIAAGVVKSVLVMIVTPLIAPKVGLNNPTAAMVYGGLMGTTSGTAGGLAATDPKLVPYGAMTATFYTGLGCLLCPSVGYVIIRAMFG